MSKQASSNTQRRKQASSDCSHSWGATPAYADPRYATCRKCHAPAYFKDGYWHYLNWRIAPKSKKTP